MVKNYLLFIFSLVLIACNSNYNPRENISVSFHKFKIDSTSIRAIKVLNNSTVAFAGSNGKYGFVQKNGTIKVNSIKTDTVVPHFRAIETINNKLFLLNVGNPALLYKMENDSLTIVYKEFNEAVFYDSMRFFDAFNGIAMGDPTEDCLSVIITNNGGNSWKKTPCNALPKTEKGEAAFAASNTNIATYNSHVWIATGGTKARILHSSNMGKTWELFETPIVQGKSTTGIYSIAFYNENQGIICGGDYTDKFGNYANKAVTFNGGKTWEPVAENLPPKYVSCVQYIPNTEGNELIAVSTNGIFFSNNKGRSWQKISEEGFYAIRFINENEAWLSANEIMVYMTIQ